MMGMEEAPAGLPGRLRAARVAAGLSQGQVARLMGLHRPTVSEIEAGNRRVTTDEVTQFALHYDVKVAWLLGEAADQHSHQDPRLELAAREIAKLDPQDLNRLMSLIAALKAGDEERGPGK